MTRFESAKGDAFRRLPAGRPLVVRRDVRRRVESQSGDDRIRVAVARVNRDPFPATALTIFSKIRRTDRRLEQTGRAEGIGNRSWTIITAIVERFVTAAENVRLAEKLVRRPDCALHCDRRWLRSGSLTRTKPCLISGHGRTRSWKRIGVCRQNDCGQNSRAN